MTWRDLIKLTLQDLRIVGAAGNVRPEDEAIGLAQLNDWIDAQKNDGAAIFEQRRTLWTLTNASSYAIGTGATINVQRPVSPQTIAGFAWVDNSLPDTPEIGFNPPLTPTEWQTLTYRTFQSAYPSRFYYEATMPTGTIYPYPIPTTGSLQGVIYSGVSVDEVTNIGAAIAMPPGYRRWMRHALRVELLDAFKSPVSEQTVARWMKLRDDDAAMVRRQNERLEEISFGVAGALFGRGGRPDNIYTGP